MMCAQAPRGLAARAAARRRTLRVENTEKINLHIRIRLN
jgi:hypothetical protein